LHRIRRVLVAPAGGSDSKACANKAIAAPNRSFSTLLPVVLEQGKTSPEPFTSLAKAVQKLAAQNDIGHDS